jgi:hypothetical protein
MLRNYFPGFSRIFSSVLKAIGDEELLEHYSYSDLYTGDFVLVLGIDDEQRVFSLAITIKIDIKEMVWCVCP